MKVKLAYGRSGLTVNLPEQTQVVAAPFTEGVFDPMAALMNAIRQPIDSRPLAELVNPGDRVTIVHSDITRPAPNHLMIPALVTELERAGIRREDITLLNGLGTHRPQTEVELRTLLGDQIVDNYRYLQHDGEDEENLVFLGHTTQGHPVRVSAQLVNADVRILTGFIEPHLFAGYSGGPKAILPAVCGAESVFTNHGLQMIAHPKATWGICEGNPIWEEMREAALMTEPTFLLNVALNENKEITGIFAGEMLAAHKAGRDFVRDHSMVAVEEPFDIIVTTNSGYPLDQSLYQSVKGMSAAAPIVRPGGAIIMAARCEDGIPDHGRYLELLMTGGSPQGVLDMIAEPGFTAQDQWQVQIQAMIQLKAEVFVYSEGLSDKQISSALFTPCHDIVATVHQLLGKYGPQARICVMPEGPQTIAYIDT
jgi:nickel-dependent lactate racemase